MLSCVAEMSEVEDDKSEILDVVAGETEQEQVLVWSVVLNCNMLSRARGAVLPSLWSGLV